VRSFNVVIALKMIPMGLQETIGEAGFNTMALLGRSRDRLRLKHSSLRFRGQLLSGGKQRHLIVV
jgi:hypothetical protein